MHDIRYGGKNYDTLLATNCKFVSVAYTSSLVTWKDTKSFQRSSESGGMILFGTLRFRHTQVLYQCLTRLWGVGMLYSNMWQGCQTDNTPAHYHAMPSQFQLSAGRLLILLGNINQVDCKQSKPTSSAVITKMPPL